jgi:RNA polymerase sigma-70 factor (ECF subfamily)
MQTTRELAAAAQAGDRLAFASLVQRYERVVISTAWSVTNDFHAAQDVAQESFLIAFRQLGSLRSPDGFGPWLLRIAKREALRRSRTRSPVGASTVAVEAVGPSGEPAWHDEQEDLIQAIGRLPEHEREVVVFHYLDGRPAVEVAELTGRPVGTVTKQLSRAVARLREWLQEKQS